MLSDEQQRWAEALKIEAMHGTDAPHWIAERIGALAIAGDAAGIARVKAIAVRLEQLLGYADVHVD